MILITVSIFILDPDEEFWLNSKSFGFVIVYKYIANDNVFRELFLVFVLISKIS